MGQVRSAYWGMAAGMGSSDDPAVRAEKCPQARAPCPHQRRHRSFVASSECTCKGGAHCYPACLPTPLQGPSHPRQKGCSHANRPKRRSAGTLPITRSYGAVGRTSAWTRCARRPPLGPALPHKQAHHADGALHIRRVGQLRQALVAPAAFAVVPRLRLSVCGVQRKPLTEIAAVAVYELAPVARAAAAGGIVLGAQ